jgi:hypothetical protein
MQPDRGPVRGEQPRRAIAEDVEACHQLERRRHIACEAADNLAEVLLQRDLALQAGAIERGGQQITDLAQRIPTTDGECRVIDAHHQQSKPLCAALQRDEDRRARIQSCQEVG